MTRTRGLCIASGTLLALFTVAGCAQGGRSGSRSASQSPAAAVVQPVAAVVQPVTTTVANAVSTAAGTNTSTRRMPRGAVKASAYGIKPNGRGGYDASGRQKAALRRAHYFSDQFGTRPNKSKPRPATRPAGR